jgi:hypothetical protein
MSDLKKPRFDPYKIFHHAAHFRESARRLRDSVAHTPDQVALIAHPSMTLSAFASELYLKCLLCAEIGEVPTDHNLKRLFDRLQLATRRGLEDLWDEYIRHYGRQPVINWIRSQPGGEKLRLDLPYALDIGADAFLELRYFYEGEGSYFLLEDFPDLLRIVILKRFPEWVIGEPPYCTIAIPS